MKFIPVRKEYSVDRDVHPVCSTPPLKFFKLDSSAHDPVFSTEHAACFDLKATLQIGDTIVGYDEHNTKFVQTIDAQHIGSAGPVVCVEPKTRLLIPTKLIFDIPFGYSVRLHARSGLSLKNGIALANAEGVIDSDYIDPVFAIVANYSSQNFFIFNGDRICQGELVPDFAYELIAITNKPQKKTNRDGGFGSTGI